MADVINIPTDRPHIVYFYPGAEITEADRNAISQIASQGPCFITTRKASETGKIECDGVAGAVPDSYKEVATAYEAILSFEAVEATPLPTVAEPKGKQSKTFAPPTVEPKEEKS